MGQNLTFLSTVTSLDNSVIRCLNIHLNMYANVAQLFSQLSLCINFHCSSVYYLSSCTVIILKGKHYVLNALLHSYKHRFCLLA